MKSYNINRGMLFNKDREIMDSKYIIESKNTGKQWRTNEIGNFFQGRNKEFYRVFTING